MNNNPSIYQQILSHGFRGVVITKCPGKTDGFTENKHIWRIHWLSTNQNPGYLYKV